LALNRPDADCTGRFVLRVCEEILSAIQRPRETNFERVGFGLRFRDLPSEHFIKATSSGYPIDSLFQALIAGRFFNFF
jgi:hypothetical protein